MLDRQRIAVDAAPLVAIVAILTVLDPCRRVLAVVVLIGFGLGV